MSLTLTQRLTVTTAALLLTSLSFAATQNHTTQNIYLYNSYSDRYVCTAHGHITEEQHTSPSCTWTRTNIGHGPQTDEHYTFTVLNHPNEYLAADISQEPGHRLMLQMPLNQTADILHDWEATFITPPNMAHDTVLLSVGHIEREENRYFLTYNTHLTDPNLHFDVLNDHELEHWLISMDYRVFHMIPVQHTVTSDS